MLGLRRWMWVFVFCFLIVAFASYWTSPTTFFQTSTSLFAILRSENVMKKHPWWDGGPGCESEGGVWNITREAATPFNITALPAGHTCGWRAWKAGTGQRVVSLTIYGSNIGYWQGLAEIPQQVSELYPGWVVRIYTDPRGHEDFFCPLLKRFPNLLYICDVTQLPQPLSSSLIHIHGTMWRFAPLGDPLVTALMVRDSDSQLSKREAAAVQEWLASGLDFHVMRDHPYHNVPVLAGMWGARWDQDPTHTEHKAREMAAIRDHMFKVAIGKSKRGVDQAILAAILWPKMKKGRVLGHDSYFCQRYSHSHPYPTQRSGGFFIGARTYRHKDGPLHKPCPAMCRPKQHQDWIYC